MSNSKLPLVVAVTGASGTAYARRLLDVVLNVDIDVHLTTSPAALQVAQHELGINESKGAIPFGLEKHPHADRLSVWRHNDFFSPIASGSFRTRGMVIVPCSMGTLAAIANGQSANLIHRAADVHLKERRKLILTPRETPLSLIALENMTTVTRAGAIVLPAMPGFYHAPKSVDDLVDFVVGRICDQLDLSVELINRWGESKGTIEDA